MPITDELRKYAESAVGQGRSQLLKAGSTVQVATERLAGLIEAAPRPSPAAVGAAELAIELISRRAEAATRRVEHLPVDYSRARSATRSRLTKSQEDAVVAIAKAQEEALARVAALRSRIPSQRPAAADFSNPSPGVSRLDPAALRGAATSSLDWAKQVLAAVNERGEARLQAGTDPRVGRLMTELDQAADWLQGHARPILETFSARVDSILGQLAGDAAGTASSAQDPAVSEQAVPEQAGPVQAVPVQAVPVQAVPEPLVAEDAAVPLSQSDAGPAEVVELAKTKRKKAARVPADMDAGAPPLLDADRASTAKRRPVRKPVLPTEEA